MPYTNVIWLYYVLKYVAGKYKGPQTPFKKFLTDTDELWKRLNPDKSHSDGAFSSAMEVLEYCVRQGWIEEKELVEMDASYVSDQA